MLRLLLINPNTSQATTDSMLHQARACLPAVGIALTAVTARNGAAMLVNDVDLSIAQQQVLALGLEFAAQCAAPTASETPQPRCGIIVAAFGNPGLAALRQRLPAHVLAWGIGEAAMLEAAQPPTTSPMPATGPATAHRRRFGIVTTTPDLKASIAQSVAALGLDDCFCGTRITPGDPLVLAANPIQQRQALAQAASQCIEMDAAQAIIVGGGPLAQAVPWLATHFAVPVISPVIAATRRAVEALTASQWQVVLT